MKFYIDSLLVLFPYDFIYPEQLEYMRSLKEGLDRRGHLVLEMPSGTGKTISLLSLLVAYWAAHSNAGSTGTVVRHSVKPEKEERRDGNSNNDDDAQQQDQQTINNNTERIRVVYCTRTVAEMVKTAGELKRLVAYWEQHEPGKLSQFTAICMSARKNLCGNADVARFTYGQEVDAACRQATAEWSKKKCPLFSSIDIEDLAVMTHGSRQQQQQQRSGGGAKSVGGAATAGAPPLPGAAALAARDQSKSKLFVPPGVHDVDALLQLGLNRGVCPYLMARHGVQFEADIVISSFLYIVDPKVSPSVTQHMPRQTIVVLDEGHNVDDVCIEALSMVVTRADTTAARDSNMKDLENGVNKMRTENRQRLAEEFQRIALGRDLVPNRPQPMMQQQQQQVQPQQQQQRNAAAILNAHAALIPNEILDKAVPGPLRQLNHFLPLLGRIVDFFHRFICRMTYPQVADPLTFLSKVRDECQTDIHHLRFLSGRLSILLQTLQVEDVHRFRHVVLIADFVTTLATHLHSLNNEKTARDPGAGATGTANLVQQQHHQQQLQHDQPHQGGRAVAYVPPPAVQGGAASSATTAQFAVVCEPHDAQNPNVPDPIIQLACLDASLAMKDVFARFDSVVLTSGTLSPLHLPPKMLGFTPVVARSLPMTLSRRCIAPLIVTRSADQASLEDVTLTSSFKVRKDAGVNKHVLGAYASLLKQLAQVVPDGICCFFTGYAYMNEVLSEWNSNGFLRELSEHKLIFIETQGVEETARCLANFRRACDIGRGAIFFSIARGKIAEGIDFDRHYGRAVLMFGVPFLPPVDRALNERLKWMTANLGLSDTEYRSFDAMRQAAQCIGRVIRNKTDYGLMILVDRRFSRPELRRKLPEWISTCIEGNGNLSTESAVTVARSFFRTMAQPWDQKSEMGNTLLDFNSLAARGFAQPQAVAKSVRVVVTAPTVMLPLPPMLGEGQLQGGGAFLDQFDGEFTGQQQHGLQQQQDDREYMDEDPFAVVDVGQQEFRAAPAPGAATAAAAATRRRGRSPQK